MTGRLVSHFVFILVVALVPLSTIFDGSRPELVHTALATCIQAILLVYLLLAFDSRRFHSVLVSFWPLWVALGGWLFISMVQSFSLLGYDNYDRAAAAYEFSLYFSCAAFFLLLTLLLDSYPRVRILVAVIVITAIVQTCFGMYNYYHGQPPFGWKPPLHSGIRVSGSFVNRNFYASWVAMSLGFVLVPLIYKRDRHSHSRGKKKEIWMRLPVVLSQFGISAFLLSGIAMSGSRGAIISVGIAVTCVAIVSLYNFRATVRFTWLSVAFLLAFSVTGFELARNRFGSLFSDSSGRTQQWGATMDMIWQKWFAGYGPGSYEIAYKTGIPLTASPLVHDHAHNDYLEILFEQGLLGALPLLVVVGLAIVYGFRKITFTRSYTRTILLVSALFGAIAMLVHGMFDFPFQVPSNALLFMALLATLLSCVLMAAPAPSHRRHSQPLSGAASSHA